MHRGRDTVLLNAVTVRPVSVLTSISKVLEKAVHCQVEGYCNHEFQRDGITICTTFTPFKPENTRLLVRKNDIIIDIRVMYDHSKGKTLMLSKNISLLVTIKGD